MDVTYQPQVGCPGFGERTEGDRKPLVEAYAVQYALTLVGSLAAGAATISSMALARYLIPMSPVGATAVGLGSGLVTGLTLLGGVALFNHIHRSYLRSELPEDLRANLPEGAPLLGVYSKAERVAATPNVESSFAWKMALLRSANQSIDWSVNFAGGPKFQEALDVIEVKLQAGVRVNLLLSGDLLHEEENSQLQELKCAYPKRFTYLISNRAAILTWGPPHTEENHVKLLIVDGKWFVLGGTGVCDQMTQEQPSEGWRPAGFGESIMDPGYRDTDLVGCGDVALAMRCQFFDLYNVWAKRMGVKGIFWEPLTQEESVEPVVDKLFDLEFDTEAQVAFVVSGPEHRKGNPITQFIAQRIQAVEGEVWLGNLACHMNVDVAQALAGAREMGRAVHGIFNGSSGSLSRILWAWQSRPHYSDRCFSAIYEYGNEEEESQKQLYHKKVGAIGQKECWVGSLNFSIKSDCYDQECALFVRSERITAQVLAGLREDERRSFRVGPTPSLRWVWPLEQISTYFIGPIVL